LYQVFGLSPAFPQSAEVTK